MLDDENYASPIGSCTFIWKRLSIIRDSLDPDTASSEVPCGY